MEEVLELSAPAGQFSLVFDCGGVVSLLDLSSHFQRVERSEVSAVVSIQYLSSSQL